MISMAQLEQCGNLRFAQHAEFTCMRRPHHRQSTFGLLRTLEQFNHGIDAIKRFIFGKILGQPAQSVFRQGRIRKPLLDLIDQISCLLLRRCLQHIDPKPKPQQAQAHPKPTLTRCSLTHPIESPPVDLLGILSGLVTFNPAPRLLNWMP